MPPRPTRPSAAGTAYILLAAMAFSAKAVIVKLAYAYPVDAATLLALRMLFSAPFFLLMALWSSRAAAAVSFTRKDWLSVGLLGFIGYYLASYLDFLGLQYVTAGLERLILFLYPTVVVLLSAWLLKKPVRRHHIAALVLSYGGIALVFAENLEIGGRAFEVALGGALVFASGVVYSFYLIGAGEVIGKLGAARFTSYAMLVACAVAMLQFLAAHDLSALALPRQVYWLSLLMAVVCTVIPAWLMAEGIRRTSANHAALVGSVGPVVTIYLGYRVLDEPISAIQLVGVVLVLAGVTLVSVKKGS
ncbi:MAG TPA: DMT family transporter [Burkholderiales bacterium]|jgi:drug/metabolite transporter (DMT)-like permease|nr:DMT family transporter [Burkholderiales bacterium]